MASTAANSGIDICSRALILIGAEPITSFEDDTTEGLVSSNMYEDIARSNLTSTRWRFSTNQAVLNRLSEAPTGRFNAAYQLPSGYLFVHAVTVNDFQIEYDIYGDKIYCDAAPQDELIIDLHLQSRRARLAFLLLNMCRVCNGDCVLDGNLLVTKV